MSQIKYVWIKSSMSQRQFTMFLTDYPGSSEKSIWLTNRGGHGFHSHFQYIIFLNPMMSALKLWSSYKGSTDVGIVTLSVPSRMSVFIFQSISSSLEIAYFLLARQGIPLLAEYDINLCVRCTWICQLYMTSVLTVITHTTITLHAFLYHPWSKHYSNLTLSVNHLSMLQVKTFQYGKDTCTWTYMYSTHVKIEDKDFVVQKLWINILDRDVNYLFPNIIVFCVLWRLYITQIKHS